jgi:hypothetical protein
MMDFVVTSDEYNNRINICNLCPHFKAGFCGTPIIGKTIKHQGKDVKLCGCEMHIKAEQTGSQCPLKKWGYGKLRFEQIAKARQLVKIHMKPNGGFKNGRIDGNALAQIWKDLTGQYAKVNCGDCAKEVLRGLKSLVDEYDKSRS